MDNASHTDYAGYNEWTMKHTSRRYCEHLLFSWLY